MFESGLVKVWIKSVDLIVASAVHANQLSNKLKRKS